MKSYLVDTSFWIAYFNKNDVNHTKSLHIFDQRDLSTTTIIFTSHIVEEIYTVGCYKYGFEFLNVVRDFMENIIPYNIIDIPVEVIIKNFMYIKKKISFTDMSGILVAYGTY